jgi:hypothetical protein
MKKILFLCLITSFRTWANTVPQVFIYKGQVKGDGTSLDEIIKDNKDKMLKTFCLNKMKNTLCTNYLVKEESLSIENKTCLQNISKSLTCEALIDFSAEVICQCLETGKNDNEDQEPKKKKEPWTSKADEVIYDGKEYKKEKIIEFQQMYLLESDFTFFKHTSTEKEKIIINDFIAGEMILGSGKKCHTSKSAKKSSKGLGSEQSIAIMQSLNGFTIPKQDIPKGLTFENQGTKTLLIQKNKKGMTLYERTYDLCSVYQLPQSCMANATNMYSGDVDTLKVLQNVDLLSENYKKLINILTNSILVSANEYSVKNGESVLKTSIQLRGIKKADVTLKKLKAVYCSF